MSRLFEKLVNNQLFFQFVSVFNTSLRDDSSTFDFDKAMDDMKSKFAPYTRSFSFCHYKIISNKVYTVQHSGCYLQLKINAKINF